MTSGVGCEMLHCKVAVILFIKSSYNFRSLNGEIGSSSATLAAGEGSRSDMVPYHFYPCQIPSLNLIQDLLCVVRDPAPTEEGMHYVYALTSSTLEDWTQ